MNISIENIVQESPILINYIEIAKMQFQLQDFMGALKTLELAQSGLNIKTPTWLIYFYKGECYEKQKKYSEAIEFYLRSLTDIKSSKSTSYIAERILRLFSENYISELENYIFNDWWNKINSLKLPADAKSSIYVLQGWCYFLQKKYDVSIENLQKSKKVGSLNFWKTKALSMAYAEMGEYKVAQEIILTASKNISQNLENKFQLYSLLAEIQLKNKSLEEANKTLIELEKMIENLDDTSKNYYILLQSKYLTYTNQWSKAYELIENNVINSNNDVELVVIKVDSLIAMHKYEAALDMNETAMMEYSKGILLFMKSQVLIEGQIDIDEGKEWLNKYLAKAGKERTLSNINKIIERRLGDGNACFFAAFAMFLLQHSHREVHSLLNKSKSLGFNYPANTSRGPYLPNLGVKLLEAELSKDAGDVQQASLLFYEVGDYYRNLGHENKARTLYEKAIESDHTNKLAEWQISLLSELPNDLDQWLSDMPGKGQVNLHSLDLLKLNIRTCLYLNQYDQLVDYIDMANEAAPDDYEIIFLTIQALIEGQYEIERAKTMFREKYFPYFNMEIIRRRVNAQQRRRSEDGNMYLFAGFIFTFLNLEQHKINFFIENARTQGLKGNRGKNDLNKYPEIGLHLLEIEISFNEGNSEKAANHYFEIARYYNWGGNSKKAEKYFKLSIELGTKEKAAYWNYADLLQRASYINTPPYREQSKIDEAYQVWGKHPVVGRSADYWAYNVAANIHEARSAFAEYDEVLEKWQTVLYNERALIHENDNYYPWVYLAGSYRNLGLNINGLLAIKTAFDKNAEENDWMREERAMLYLNAGFFQFGAIYVNELIEQHPDNQLYSNSWKGFIAYHSENFEEALNLFEEKLKADPNDFWCLGFKMRCLYHLLKLEEAQAVAKTILDLEDKAGYEKEEGTMAMAKFVLLDWPGAIRLLNNLAQRIGQNDELVNLNLAILYLCTGDFSRAKLHFEKFSRWSLNRREYIGFLIEIRTLNTFLNQKDWVNAVNKDEFANTLQTWENSLSTFLNEHINTEIIIEENSDSVIRFAYEELSNELEKGAFIEGELPWISIQAGFGRLFLKAGVKQEALKIYDYLKQPSFYDYIPESRIAVTEIHESVLHDIARQVQQSQFFEALKALSQLNTEYNPHLIRKFALLALAHFGNLEEGAANTSIQTAADIILSIKKEGEKENLENIFFKVITETWQDPGILFRFRIFLYSDIFQLSGPNEYSPFIQRLRSGVEKSFEDKIKNLTKPSIGPFPQPFPPSFIPIIIEVGNEQVAQFDSINNRIRDEIKNSYGVDIPLIIFRDNAAMQYNSFHVLLNELPLHLGIVPEESNFNEEYISVRIKYILERCLYKFVDLDYTYKYLNTLNDSISEEVIVTAKDIRDNPKKIIQFHKILKKLLQDRVPIIEKEKIILSFRKYNGHVDKINLCIQDVRQNIKEQLPTNSPLYRRIPLPSQVEKKVKASMVEIDQKQCLMNEPQGFSDILLLIERILPEYDGHSEEFILQVSESALRPFVQDLVRIAYPTLLVVDKNEILN